jgi:hypothetical protein
MFGQVVCKGCGQAIIGNYISALGATWHPEHFVCASCGRPIDARSFNLDAQGHPYHTECFARSVAPRCAYCNKPLMGAYLTDYWGTHFCKEHADQFPRCDFCGRLVPPGDREQGAESLRCPTCRASAIDSVEEARPIFKQLIQWVSSQGLRYNNLPLSLELCGRARLAQYLDKRGTAHSLGVTMSTTYTQDGRLIRTEVKGVAVFSGLPGMLFKGVTLHELGHVWLVVQGIDHLPAWAEEGFCELLAYRYYSEAPSVESRYHAENIARNSDPVYGEGFRRVQAIAERMGWQRFIETLRATKQLPRT